MELRCYQTAIREKNEGLIEWKCGAGTLSHLSKDRGQKGVIIKSKIPPEHAAGLNSLDAGGWRGGDRYPIFKPRCHKNLTRTVDTGVRTILGCRIRGCEINGGTGGAFDAVVGGMFRDIPRLPDNAVPQCLPTRNESPRQRIRTESVCSTAWNSPSCKRGKM